MRLMVYSPRNTKYRVKNNTINKSKTAISVGVNSQKELFIVENNIYNNCNTKFGDQSWSTKVFEGIIMDDGTFIIYDDLSATKNSKYGSIANAPVCFYPKLFKKGDIVISRKSFITKATCNEDYEEAIADNKLWKLDGTITSNLRDMCTIIGQSIFDTTVGK